MASILDVQNIYSGYGKIEVLHNISIHVEPNEIVCIIGPNGSGKSTLLKTIFGLIKTRQGSILFSGKEITQVEPEEKVVMGISYIPQGRNIFPSLTVKENGRNAASPRQSHRESHPEYFPTISYSGQSKGDESRFSLWGRKAIARSWDGDYGSTETDAFR